MSEEEFPDYYVVLGVQQTATAEEIRKAYLTEIDFWHPDRFQGRRDYVISRAEQMAQRLNAAKSMLLDPAKREIYDTLYSEWKGIMGAEVSPPKPPPGSFTVLSFLKQLGVEMVDKRPQGGCLWVLGGVELAAVMAELKGRGLLFTFTPGGGRATRHRPAWYLRQ